MVLGKFFGHTVGYFGKKVFVSNKHVVAESKRASLNALESALLSLDEYHYADLAEIVDELTSFFISSLGCGDARVGSRIGKLNKKEVGYLHATSITQDGKTLALCCAFLLRSPA